MLKSIKPRNRDPTPKHRSHPQVQILPPRAENIVKWFVVSFAVPALQTTEKCERTKHKVTAHVLETIKMVKRKRAFKNLQAHDKKEEKDM